MLIFLDSQLRIHAKNVLGHIIHIGSTNHPLTWCYFVSELSLWMKPCCLTSGPGPGPSHTYLTFNKGTRCVIHPTRPPPHITFSDTSNPPPPNAPIWPPPQTNFCPGGGGVSYVTDSTHTDAPWVHTILQCSFSSLVAVANTRWKEHGLISLLSRAYHPVLFVCPSCPVQCP